MQETADIKDIQEMEMKETKDRTKSPLLNQSTLWLPVARPNTTRCSTLLTPNITAKSRIRRERWKGCRV